MTTEIIVVKYGNKEVEDRCIRSVLEHTDVPYNLTVYDNLETNFPLSSVWNSLIGRSNAEAICLLNSDTVVEPGWLGGLLAELKPGVGAVGPVSNRAGHQTSERGAGTWETNMVSGFCMVFLKKSWLDAGMFDEGYKLYFEDDDFCQRLLAVGYSLKVVRSVHVFHEQRASTKNNPLADEHFRESKERFEKMWEKGWNPSLW